MLQPICSRTNIEKKEERMEKRQGTKGVTKKRQEIAEKKEKERNDFSSALLRYI